MSLLNGKLSTSSGLGGAPSAGAYSTSTYGMGSMMGQAYTTATVGAVTTGGSFLQNIKNAPTDAIQGRASLAVLEAMLLVLVGFYIWTHAVQGGG
jgi:hypothetical protein